MRERIRRLLIGDAHPIVHRDVTELLDRESGVDVCRRSGTNAGEIKQANAAYPNLVRVDISPNDGERIEWIIKIKARYADA